MRLYFAGPLFSAAERDWNEEFAAALRNEGHEVFLPQDKERGLDAARIFSTDVGGGRLGGCPRGDHGWPGA